MTDVKTTKLRTERPFFVDQMLHKLKNVAKKLTLKGSLNDYTTIIETDFDNSRYGDHHTPGLNSYGTFEDGIEMRDCRLLAKRIKTVLGEVREKELDCEILVPCGLIMKIAQDIMRMSHSEPCGLRGCVLFINLEEKNKCRRLVRLACDPNTVSTFELHLTLKEDTRSWCYVKKVFISFSGCFQHKSSMWSPSFKILCSGFVLEKKKLYRPNH